MEIIKRDQSVQAYDRRKISRAVNAAFDSVGHPLPDMTKEAPKITARHAAMQEIATIRRCFRLFCRSFSAILRRTSAIRSS